MIIVLFWVELKFFVLYILFALIFSLGILFLQQYEKGLFRPSLYLMVECYPRWFYLLLEIVFFFPWIGRHFEIVFFFLVVDTRHLTFWILIYFRILNHYYTTIIPSITQQLFVSSGYFSSSFVLNFSLPLCLCLYCNYHCHIVMSLMLWLLLRYVRWKAEGWHSSTSAKFNSISTFCSHCDGTRTMWPHRGEIALLSLSTCNNFECC